MYAFQNARALSADEQLPLRGRAVAPQSAAAEATVYPGAAARRLL